jgi:uncharacterized protein YcbK (DUF882 family)
VKLALVLLVLFTAPVLADAPYQSKKDRERAGKSTKHGPPPAAGTKPAKLIHLYNRHTNDWLAVDPLSPPTLSEISSFLRCHYTNEGAKMEPKLISVAVAAAQTFKSDFVDVVSGFRHPKYNLMLRKKGRQVARDSQHSHGNAIDFAIPGVTTEKLHEWAKAQKLGGVGIYLTNKFVHMDTGPIRYWEGD